MKGKTLFGALLVSVALCSQGFGFELLDRMLGLNCGGCGECNACAKVACCEKACPKPCEPACEKACPKACEQACGEASCGNCCKCRPTPVRDLFANLKEMFEAKGTCAEPVSCEKPCKARKCGKAKCGACCPVEACEPACEPTCEVKCHKLYRRPVVELLESLFCCEKCNNGCGTGCEAACAAGCGGSAPAAAPAKAPEQAAPLPQAPKADPSASIQSRGIYQASRSLVRN